MYLIEEIEAVFTVSNLTDSHSNDYFLRLAFACAAYEEAKTRILILLRLLALGFLHGGAVTARV
jgi:hypothetical protein